MATKKTERTLDISIFYKESGCAFSRVELSDPAHQKLLEDATGTPIISSSAISNILFDQWGISISKDVISRHRSIPQRCACRSIPK